MGWFALAALLFVIPACGGDGSREGPTVVLQAGDQSTTVAVEVADSPDERSVGLSGREELPADAGMLFLFDGPVTQGFWMKDTLIPLSIAFLDADGRIVAVRSMEPCRREPCPLYEPGRLYSSALEVNDGAFDRWGVGVGDRVLLGDAVAQE
jgi:uncharacterized membrane protein (UPF0127 family)